MSKDLRNGGLAALTIEDIVAPGFSTPWDAPTVPPFPFSFRDVEVLTLVWRTTEAAVARVLPPPLQPTSDVVLAHIYRMNDTDWLGPYSESNISVGARLASADVSGSYSPYLFLSSDVGVVHGREVHGQPKKLGEPQDRPPRRPRRRRRREERDRHPHRHDGLQAAPRRPQQPFAPFRFRREHQSEGRRPHRRHTPAIRQLTARRLADVSVHECWSGPCTVELRPNAQAPVHRLPVVEMLDGFHWRADFTLVEGRVIYDYLAK